MDKESKDKLYLVIVSFSFGIFLLLEGLNITQFGETKNNTPEWILAVVGFMFILAGVMILIGGKARWNDLFASIVIALMGIVFGWISLFGDSSGFSGGVAILSDITGISFQRILFGLGSLSCFSVSIYAFIQFYKKST